MKTIALKVSDPLHKKIIDSSINDEVSISSFLRKTINYYFEKSGHEKTADVLKKIDENIAKMKERDDIESNFVRKALIILTSKDIALSKRMEKLI